MRITDWDDAYRNAAYIPETAELFASWAQRSDAFRAAHPPEVLSYGPGARQVVDLHLPDGPAQGLTVFVHGGYWHECTGRDFSFAAAGPFARGQAVAVVTYPLAPEARLTQITRNVADALARVARHVDGPIRLAGHSAGGHLVTRMVCAGVLATDVVERIVHVLSISGVHDLRPLLRTQMNATLALTAKDAATESPALLFPVDGLCLTCAVGSRERPEFLRQNDLLANVWTGLGADCRTAHLEGENHFTILDGLFRADGPLTGILLDQTRSNRLLSTV